jgi:hypothetical protein
VTRGDRELELALRRADRAIAEYAVAPPVDSRVVALCQRARRWIVPALDRVRGRAGSGNALGAAGRFLDDARRQMRALSGELSVRDRDILAGCIYGVESALARARRRASALVR